jgi:hypothetical protein
VSDWKTCEHEWETDTGSWDCPLTEEQVVCKKCGCPGQRTIKTGEVYWPTT